MGIRDFELAWRWTDPKYVELPPDILDRISALGTESAAAVHDRWFPCFDKHGQIIPSKFSRVERCRTEGTSHGDSCRRESPLIQQVADWLRTQETNCDLSVVVSWRRDCAVQTTWEIFSLWWDDFCYGGSDDVLIVPESSNWMLAFDHEDEFSFCHCPLA